MAHCQPSPAQLSSAQLSHRASSHPTHALLSGTWTLDVLAVDQVADRGNEDTTPEMDWLSHPWYRADPIALRRYLESISRPPQAHGSPKRIAVPSDDFYSMTHQSKKKRIDDDSLPPDAGSKPVQLQRRRVWRACESCRYVSVLRCLFDALFIPSISDARRSNATAANRLVRSARHRDLNVPGSRPRTGLR